MSSVIDPDLDGKVAIIVRGQKDTNDRFRLISLKKSS